MRNTNLLLHKAVFTVVLLLLSSEQHAWAQTPPPQLTLTTEKQTYQLGEPIALTMMLTNVSDEPQQYGPVRVLGSRLRLRILDAALQEVPGFGYWGDDVGAPWIENALTATLPGETEQGSLLITHFYDLTQAGTYTLELDYTQTAYSTTGKRNGGFGHAFSPSTCFFRRLFHKGRLHIFQNPPVFLCTPSDLEIKDKQVGDPDSPRKSHVCEPDSHCQPQNLSDNPDCIHNVTSYCRLMTVSDATGVRFSQQDAKPKLPAPAW